MLRRAGIFAVVAVLMALVGYSGLLDATVPVAWLICYVSIAFAALSLMFSLFEDADRPHPTKRLASLHSHENPR